MRIFCELRGIFPSNEQNVRSYYMLNKRGLLFHYKKKKMLFCNWCPYIFKSIQKHPDSVCEDDVNNKQNVRAYYMPNHRMRR